MKFLLYISCSADHVSGWQPRIEMGKVEARLVVKNTHHTRTHTIQRKMSLRLKNIDTVVAIVITYIPGM